MYNELDIIKENSKLIYSISKKFYGVEKEDLIQAGLLGLKKALINYKPSENCKFSTYAYKSIFGEMYALSIKNKSLKINKEILQKYKEIIKAKEFLTNKFNKEITFFELSHFLEIDYSELTLIINSCESILSLDNENDNINLYNIISNNNQLNVDDSIDLMESIEKLNNEEQKIISERYFNDLTQVQTAKKLGLTQVMVSRYEKKALKKMKQYIL